MLTPEQRAANLAAIARVAVNVERETGFPGAALIAQWALESDWGGRPTGDSNYWGLTRAVAPDRAQKWCATTERLSEKQMAELDPEERARIRRTKAQGDGFYHVELERRFPCFDTVEQAAERYVALITTGHRYLVAWGGYKLDGNVWKLLGGIAAAGYATDPGYSALLKQIAGQENVQEALKQARA